MKKKARNTDFYGMFTGIIEAKGEIVNIAEIGTNKTFEIRSPLASQLKVDQSLSHDGVCLTVESASDQTYQVTAIAETLLKSRLSDWKVGDQVNLERCLTLNSRLDGHIVQGHVDCTATCKSREDMTGSWVYRFEFPENYGHLVIEKGSIAVNGISLTCFDVVRNTFSVAVIPYTFDHTNIADVKSGMRVNVEFDMIGKYVQRQIELSSL